MGTRIGQLIGGLVMLAWGLFQMYDGLQKLGYIAKPGESATEIAAEAAASVKDMKTITVPGQTYKIKCPSSWKVELPKGEAMSIKADHPKSMANFNVIAEEIAAEAPLAEVYKASKSNLEEMMKKQGTPIQISQEVPTKLGPLPAMKMLIAYTVKGLPLRITQVLAVKGRAIYYVTFTATENRFDAFTPVGDAVAASFEP